MTDPHLFPVRIFRFHGDPSDETRAAVRERVRSIKDGLCHSPNEFLVDQTPGEGLATADQERAAKELLTRDAELRLVLAGSVVQSTLTLFWYTREGERSDLEPGSTAMEVSAVRVPPSLQNFILELEPPRASKGPGQGLRVGSGGLRYDFFIAYVRREETWVRQLHQRLLEAGKTVFIDLEIPVSSRWDLEIERALEASQVFVVVLSDEGDSHYRSSEIQKALELYRRGAMRVLPVYRGLRPEHAPYGLNIIKGVELSREAGPEAAVDALLRSIDRVEPPKARPLMVDVPPAPAIFLGRELTLADLTAMLGNSGTEVNPSPVAVSAMHGLSGIGKTAAGIELAVRNAHAAGFVDGVLWAEGGSASNFLWVASRWGRAASWPDLERAASPREAVAALRALLAERRFLVVLDDLTSVELLALFRQATGRGSAVLVITRIRKLALEAGIPESHTHELKPLDPDASLELISRICPGIGRETELRRMLARFEFLPLATHVAGRLLRRARDANLDLDRHIADLDESQLVGSTAPIDRVDLDTGLLPSVRALLRRSVEMLPAVERERFARLAVFAKRTAIDSRALANVWDVDDPEPTVASLHEHGLLETLSDGRYRLHGLMRVIASEMLSGDNP